MAWRPSRVSDAAKRSKRRRIHAMRLINQNRTGQPWVKPGNDGCASSRRMRRYREPFPVLLRPAIGVAPVRLLSVRRGVTERRMQTAKPVAIKNLQAHDVKIRIMGDFAIIQPRPAAYGRCSVPTRLRSRFPRRADRSYSTWARQLT